MDFQAALVSVLVLVCIISQVSVWISVWYHQNRYPYGIIGGKPLQVVHVPDVPKQWYRISIKALRMSSVIYHCLSIFGFNIWGQLWMYTISAVYAQKTDRRGSLFLIFIYIIWLESTRKYIPISRMPPNHVQSGGSPELIFSKKCTNPFAFFQ